MLNHEYQLVKNTAAGTCILREGRSDLLHKFQCEKLKHDDDDDDDVWGVHYIEYVDCKKCLKKEDLWEMVRTCKESRSD